MKTLQIINVNYIPVTPKNSQAWFRLNIAGQEPILRSEAEFLTDLRNSFLIGANVRNANHPELLAVLRDLQGATITGEISFVKKGDKWTVTENSQVVKPDSVRYNPKVTVGDQLPYEKDMSLVTDGFLNLALAPHINMINKQAMSYGTALASMLNTFDPSTTTGANTATTSGAEPPVDNSIIDDDVLKEATASAQAEDKKEPTKQ